MDFDGGGSLSRQELFVGLMNVGGDATEKELLEMNVLPVWIFVK